MEHQSLCATIMCLCAAAAAAEASTHWSLCSAAAGQPLLFAAGEGPSQPRRPSMAESRYINKIMNKCKRSQNRKKEMKKMIRGTEEEENLVGRLSRGWVPQEIKACLHNREQSPGHGGHSAAMCWPRGRWALGQSRQALAWIFLRVRGGRMLMSVLSRGDPFVWLDPSGCYVEVAWMKLRGRCWTNWRPPHPIPCCRLPESFTFSLPWR